ncbi:TetR/AcrR family transcriptional regulator [Puniceibacterium confluentis]|uniref:TetR/AcrR family transcriptional regulator n=1 Tax=Puniceibacterium confluentis TaxID=1958944 RepID=UPI0011B79BDF|nr:TetR/AcrR family transcriptional regulator [Puniceibacterium confluentis]
MAVKTSGWRGSEELWLEAAYQLLIEQGVEAVKVMPLAKRVGLSRTSFYGHFDSREALLAALIARWQDKNTGNMVARTRAFAETIAEAVLNLFDCWLQPGLFDAQLDFAIRNWALGDPALRAVLESTDQDRIAAIRAMFERFGYAPAEAEVRAFTVYYTQIGYVSMMVVEPPELRLPRMPYYVQTFTGTAASDSELARFVSRHGMTLQDLRPDQG